MTTENRKQKTEAGKFSSISVTCHPISGVQGFTLIEAMVAVTILTIAVAGPMFTANRAIVAARISRDQLTASYLAQEGIEYVRATRDNAYLAASGNTGVGWTSFMAAIGQCRTPNICTLGPMQSGTLPITSCPTGIACTAPFSLLSNGTPLTRTIQTVSATVNDERIVSTVSWSFHGTPYSVTISDHLTKWQ